MRRLLRHLGGSFGEAWPAAIAIVGVVAAMTPLRTAFFEGAPYGQAAIVALVAVIIASITPRSWSLVVELLLGIAATTVLVLFVLAEPPRPIGLPRAINPLAVWVDVATGPSNILAAPLPIEMSSRLLALPLALCWSAGHLTVLLVRRTRSTVASALPSMAVAIVVLLLGPGQLSVLAGSIVALACLAHIAARAATVGLNRGPVDAAGSGQYASLWRYVVRSYALVGLPAVAVAGLVGASLAVVAGGDPTRTDLHDAAGVLVEDELTPLSALAPQLIEGEDTELFTIELQGASGLTPADLDRLRVATLERYDGALWSSDGVFLPVVRRVRQPDRSGRPAVAITSEIRLTAEYASSYLPVAGLLREVDGRALGLNEDTDTLVSGMAIGEPATVRFTSAIPTGPRPSSPSSQPPSGGETTGLAGFEVPEEFEGFADAVAGDLTDPVERLEAMEAAMADESLFGYSATSAYSGHSLPVLANYLGPQPQPGFAVARQGYAEQAAAAFTLLARMEGLPARVSVGYLLPDPEAALDGDVVSVTAADAHAWSEVYLGDEWVAFEPTDRTERIAEELPAPELDETALAPPAVDDPVVAPRVRPERPEPEPPSLTRWILLALAVVGLVALPIVIKAGRRVLRRRGTPSARLVGAWRELRDRLRDQGVPVTRSTTARDLDGELSAGASPEVMAEYRQFAQLLDHGLFAAHEPEEETAALAWKLVPRLARKLAVGRSRWRRLAAPIRLRSLRRPPVGRVHRRPDPVEEQASDPPLAPAVDRERAVAQ